MPPTKISAFIVNKIYRHLLLIDILLFDNGKYSSYLSYWIIIFEHISFKKN